MESSDDLLCLFSAEITKQDESYVIEVPKQEVTVGSVDGGDVYRVALLSRNPDSSESTAAEDDTRSAPSAREYGSPDPPVEEGETRTVEIEDLGDQGDGIARVERGYVIIVPDAEMGERVVIEVTTVKENVAFADVEERVNYYE